MNNLSPNKYRQDIDGLRALAVLTVVAFHFGIIKFAPGGFIGVDIFFVISGYLISGILFREINSGAFSIKSFYVRRVRRIFPALFIVYIVCIIGSLLINFPSESATVGKTIVASIFFSSNIFFFNTSSYFSTALESNPLLHTWSLSVEEQFYVLFPLLVFSIRRLQHKTQLIIISASAIVSFGLSTMAVFNAPTAAFYLVHNRAWELLIGAVLTLAPIPFAKRRWILECAALMGLLLIVMSNLLLSPASLFPGPSALAACVGAGLLIYSGATNRTTVSKLLSFAPIRFIGLISYSLYLWHWPIIVFVRQIHEPKGILEKSAILVVSVFVAYLSWQFIEKPFRKKPFTLTGDKVLSLSGALMTMVCLMALLMSPVNRMIWDTPKRVDELLAFENYATEKSMRSGSCFLTSQFNKFSMFDKDNCLHTVPDKRNYLVLGDSHAAHLWYGFQSAYSQINFLQATASGCKPILESQGEARCTDLVKYIFQTFLPNNHIDGVILSGRWTLEEVEPALRTAAFLTSYASQVIISGPIQEYDQALPRILALAASQGLDYGAFAAKHLRSEQRFTDDAFTSAKLPERVAYVSVFKAVNAPECKLITHDNIPVQFDYGHLTMEGSTCVAKQFNLP